MREKISSLLDGEHHDLDYDHTFEQIDNNHDLKQVWHNYHLIGAVMRSESGHHNFSLVERIKDSLLKEPQADAGHSISNVVTPGFFASSTWFPALALAASIAMVAVITFYTNPVEHDTLITDNETVWNGATEQASADVLNGYLIQHGEFTGMANMNGLMAYAKYVSYDSQ